MAAILTNVGIAKVNNALNGGAHTPPQHVGWGTGTDAAAAANTALQTPAAEARVSGTKTLQTVTVTDDTYQVVATITSASGQTISEVGLFDASTVGNMYIRGVFTGVPLANGDSIQFTIKNTIAQP